MANQIQESLLNAIDTIVNQRIENIEADKTIVATVIECSNAAVGEYKLSYHGGFITAYAQKDVNYTNNSSVYVLIPQGDFSNKKYIVSQTHIGDDDSNITFVSSALDDYNIIGENAISSKNLNPFAIGLNSNLKEDATMIYQHPWKQEELLNVYPDIFNIDNDSQSEINAAIQQEYINPDNYVDIDDEIVSQNVREATNFIFEAKFLTRLSKAHRTSGTGYYGLALTLAFYDRSEVSSENVKSIDDDISPKYVFKTYTLDINNMTGDPFRFTKWSNQYNIYNLDRENFSHIENIVFFSYGFSEPDILDLHIDQDDIFVDKLEFYGLKPIDAKNGDFSLHISMPLGNTIYEYGEGSEERTSTNIIARCMKKSLDISQHTTYHWFIEDPLVRKFDKHYNAYAGLGWRYLDTYGHTSVLKVDSRLATAYSNKFLCIAMYRDNMILKDTFYVYNKSNEKKIEIKSALGTKFAFDRGEAKLTCFVDDKETDFDKNYSFVWSKFEKESEAIIFNQTKKELQEQLKSIKEELIALENKKQKDSANFTEADKKRMKELSAQNITVNKQIKQYASVIEYNQNHFTYAIKGLNTKYAIFKCTVYEKRLTSSNDRPFICVGSAEITLENENITQPIDYSISIENGNQVFQYNEAGVSPAHERYAEPLEIQPLICHFYDPNGLEVDPNTYTITWQFPLDHTLLELPDPDTVIRNPVTEQDEWCTTSVYPLKIHDSYSSQAFNNQILAIVYYHNQRYVQYTNFLFTKIGENGTNGTDIVARIKPIKDLDDSLNQLEKPQPLTLICNKEIQNQEENQICAYDFHWNVDINNNAYATKIPLQFNLFRQSEEVLSNEYNDLRWKVVERNGQFFDLDNKTGQFSFHNKEEDKEYQNKLNNLIIQCSAKMGAEKQYSCTYNIPIIYYHTNVPYTIEINKSLTLKEILYNADGRNPLYNHNQGVDIRVVKTNSTDNLNLSINWQMEGGDNRYFSEEQKTTIQYWENPTVGAKLYFSDINSDILKKTANDAVLLSKDNKENFIEIFHAITPADVYDGAFSNHVIHGIVKNNDTNTIDVEFYIPIYMHLNTYGLASLNAWDGNHLEINEEDDYILAPQIGAGVKHEDNSFTGIVMGKADQYCDNPDPKKQKPMTKEKIGVLGYSRGHQSIFLNAEDGSATFGLPKTYGEEEKNYGTINTSYGPEDEGIIQLKPYGVSTIGSWRIGSKTLFNVNGHDRNGNPLSTKDMPAYKDLPKEEYKMSIPYDKSGVLLSAFPSYLSIKGEQLKRRDIKYDSANTIVQGGDSFELQLDPQDKDSSIFTVYRHTSAPDNDLLFEVKPVKRKTPDKDDSEKTTTQLAICVKQADPKDGIELQNYNPLAYLSNQEGFAQWELNMDYIKDSAYPQSLKGPHDIRYGVIASCYAPKDSNTTLKEIEAKIDKKEKRVFSALKEELLSNVETLDRDFILKHFNIVKDKDSTDKDINVDIFNFLNKKEYQDIYIEVARILKTYANLFIKSIEDKTIDEELIEKYWESLMNKAIPRMLMAYDIDISDKMDHFTHIPWGFHQIQIDLNKNEEFFVLGKTDNQIDINNIQYTSDFVLPKDNTINIDADMLNKWNDSLIWHRESKVGIDKQGRFYTNALKDSTTALSIGNMGAFGSRALDSQYVGANFAVGSKSNSNTLFKMFTDMEQIDNNNGTLYLSGAEDIKNECERPIQIYGKHIQLFAKENDNNYKTSINQISLTSTDLKLGQFQRDEKLEEIAQNKNENLKIPICGIRIPFDSSDMNCTLKNNKIYINTPNNTLDIENIVADKNSPNSYNISQNIFSSNATLSIQIQDSSKKIYDSYISLTNSTLEYINKNINGNIELKLNKPDTSIVPYISLNYNNIKLGHNNLTSTDFCGYILTHTGAMTLQTDAVGGIHMTSNACGYDILCHESQVSIRAEYESGGERKPGSSLMLHSDTAKNNEGKFNLTAGSADIQGDASGLVVINQILNIGSGNNYISLNGLNKSINTNGGQITCGTIYASDIYRGGKTSNDQVVIQSELETAKANAISTAESYTDTKKGEIESWVKKNYATISTVDDLKKTVDDLKKTVSSLEETIKDMKRIYDGHTHGFSDLYSTIGQDKSRESSTRGPSDSMN